MEKKQRSRLDSRLGRIGEKTSSIDIFLPWYNNLLKKYSLIADLEAQLQLRAVKPYSVIKIRGARPLAAQDMPNEVEFVFYHGHQSLRHQALPRPYQRVVYDRSKFSPSGDILLAGHTRASLHPVSVLVGFNSWSEPTLKSIAIYKPDNNFGGEPEICFRLGTKKGVPLHLAWNIWDPRIDGFRGPEAEENSMISFRRTSERILMRYKSTTNKDVDLAFPNTVIARIEDF